MKKVTMLLLVFVVLTCFKATANDSCKIFFNKQLIFEGVVDQENAVALVKARQFKKTDCFTIRYYSETESKGWKRTIYINAADERNLKTVEMTKQTGSVSVKASVLNKLKETKQPVLIYTSSLPSDPAMAARVRVRRMFICKIEWH